MMRLKYNVREEVVRAIRQIHEEEMRWSYLALVGLVVAGVCVNLLLPSGWTIWPFIFVAGVMSMVHEAAERNGEGVPPLYVYAFVVAALALWVIGAVAFSALNPVVFFIGAVAIAYQCARGYIRQYQHDRLIAFRRENQLCVHCGEPAKDNHMFCEACGNEPDPEKARLKRTYAIASGKGNRARLRDALTPKAPTAGAKAKEAQLVARHHKATRRK